MGKRTCKACNQGEILDRAVAGRQTRYRCVPDLEIPADVAIPTCTHCGTEYLDAAAAQRLDEGLKDAFQRVLSKKMDSSLEALRPHIAQRDLERLLGLSGGYLSKLKGGKETSAPLVAALMLLSSEPAMRLVELREAWEVQGADEVASFTEHEQVALPNIAVSSGRGSVSAMRLSLKTSMKGAA